MQMTRDQRIKEIIGNAYGWDDELNELQYRGNPVSYWMTETERRAVEAVSK